MISAMASAFTGMNPMLSGSWIPLAWWVIPIVHAGLIIWAIVELARNRSLDLAPKIAFAVLIVLAPFVGSILTIVLVRSHARSEPVRRT